ncbi:MAG: hypothetical protein J5I98_29560, partial [Phaeodactylibacter sp.]|nr:hypothetical protein [Phaeodactylibacter sp.]
NIVLNEARGRSIAEATQLTSNEVQNNICRSQPIKGFSDRLLVPPERSSGAVKVGTWRKDATKALKHQIRTKLSADLVPLCPSL